VHRLPRKDHSIQDDRVAVIDISGTRREVYLDLIDEDVTVGDYVISHAGYALHKVDEETARESLSYLKTIIESEA